MPFRLFRLRSAVPRRGVRLHVGAGRERLEGWVNLDVQKLPGVDLVADVTDGLDFEECEAIYAEHFLEHLRIDDAIDFLAECHRVLAPGGWLRLSTPNLEWVLVTHYHPWLSDEENAHEAILLNRAFHGWRHRFLWNRQLLGRTLAACGFDPVVWCRWRQSEQELFAGIERHEPLVESDEHPHVLVVEARKPETAAAGDGGEDLAELRETIDREFLSHLDD